MANPTDPVQCKPLEVQVGDKGIERAIKHLKRKMAAEGILRELKRPAEALDSYDRALALKPDHADALCNRGSALRELKRSLARLPETAHPLDR